MTVIELLKKIRNKKDKKIRKQKGEKHLKHKVPWPHHTIKKKNLSITCRVTWKSHLTKTAQHNLNSNKTKNASFINIWAHN